MKQPLRIAAAKVAGGSASGRNLPRPRGGVAQANNFLKENASESILERVPAPPVATCERRIGNASKRQIVFYAPAGLQRGQWDFLVVKTAALNLFRHRKATPD